MDNKDINKLNANGVRLVKSLLSDKEFTRPTKVGSISLCVSPKVTNPWVLLDTPDNKELIKTVLKNYYGDQL